MRLDSIEYEFVELMPKSLSEGVLYVSTAYATAVHLCCCGCGNRVVTPLSPAQWSITFDGDSISLTPSVGSHDLECASHYWIRKGKIRWSRTWSADEVAKGRDADRRDLSNHFSGAGKEATNSVMADKAAGAGARGLRGRLRRPFAARRRG
jgi:hypothetical protein